MTCHISSNITWTTWVHLNTSFQNLLILAKNRTIKIDAQLWNAINPLGPSFLLNFTFGNCIFEFSNQLIKFLFGKIGVLESVFNFFILNSVKWHFSCTWTNSNDFSIFIQKWKNFFREVDSSKEVLNIRRIIYCSKSIIKDVNIKCVTFSSDTSIIDQNVNVMILFFDQRNESFNTFGIWHIKLFHMDLGFWVFGEDLWPCFVGEFNVSASHNDVPVFASCQVFNDAVPNAFIGASDNDVSYLVHLFGENKRIFISNQRYSDIYIWVIRKFNLLWLKKSFFIVI